MIQHLNDDMAQLVAERETIRCILEQARTYLARDETWIRDRLAVDSTGQSVRLGSRSARRFCAIGAIRRAMIYDLEGTAFFPEARVLGALGVDYRGFITLNDFDGREAVLKIIDAWLENNPS